MDLTLLTLVLTCRVSIFTKCGGSVQVSDLAVIFGAQTTDTVIFSHGTNDDKSATTDAPRRRLSRLAAISSSASRSLLAQKTVRALLD
jgi:hypothetical protein